MRLSTIHQIVIAGAAVGAGLVCLYAGLLAHAGRGSSWGTLAAASGSCALLFVFYLRRFRRLHQAHPRTP